MKRRSFASKVRVLHTLWWAVAALQNACGGGEVTAPTTPVVDNSVRRVDISPASAVALVSGASQQFTASAFTASGQPVTGQAATWTTSDPNVVTVTGGLAIARLVGTASVSAQVAGLSSASVTVTVSAGAATQLGLKTQPTGAASGVAFVTQPIVEVRDAAGNPVSGGTGTITASIASGGGTLAGTATASMAAGVATFTGLAVSGVTGPRTLSFSTPGLAQVTSTSFVLNAGPAKSLAVRTQPVAGTTYVPFVTPASVEARDADGNVAPTAAPVVASIASGGGTLGGVTTVTPVGGVAMFDSLTIVGVAGARTLTFTAGALGSVTTASFVVAAAPPAVIAFAPAQVTLGGATGATLAPVLVQVQNAGVVPLTNLSVAAITYGPAQPVGWLTATLGAANAPAVMTLAVTAPATAGTYTATVQVAGAGATISPVSFPVTLTVQTPLVNSYGTPATRTSVVNVGSSVSPAVTTVTNTGAPATDALAFVARAPSVVSVDASGKITALAEGSSWVVVTSPKAPLPDSVYVIVPRNGTGPVLRTDLTTYNFRIGDTVTARVLLDMRGAKNMGAITAFVAWTRFSNNNNFNAMAFIDFSTAASTVSPLVSTDVTTGVVRVSAASVAGAAGVIELGRIRFRANVAGDGFIYLNASELLAVDLTDLLPATTLTQFPVIIR